MALRKIINIDEEKCNGCGLCVPNCAEGAIKIVDGKARLIGDNLCDGLGACLGHCPKGALIITEREADEFDEAEVHKQLQKEQQKAAQPMHQHHGGGCPGSRMMEINRQADKPAASAVSSDDIEVRIKSQLTQWPVQLSLAPVNAPYFEDADLLITADCVPFAYPNYHLDILKGKKVVVGCPKLDDIEHYASKLAEIVKNNSLKSITVAYMEVPCCTGIVRAAEEALNRSGKDLPLHRIRISINGDAARLS